MIKKKSFWPLNHGEEDLCDGRITLRDGERRTLAMKIPIFLGKKMDGWWCHWDREEGHMSGLVFF